MQLTYYRFPADMPIRDCYDAWEKGREGYESPPADMTDAELEEEWPRQQLCNVRTAKKFLRKYGGGRGRSTSTAMAAYSRPRLS